VKPGIPESLNLSFNNYHVRNVSRHFKELAIVLHHQYELGITACGQSHQIITRKKESIQYLYDKTLIMITMTTH